jgi:hypothetical protein
VITSRPAWFRELSDGFAAIASSNRFSRPAFRRLRALFSCLRNHRGGVRHFPPTKR